MSQYKKIELPIIEIERRKELQIRPLDQKTVNEYAEDYRAHALFPAIIVFAEEGSERYLLADGEHRVEGCKKAGFETILAEIRPGGIREALKYALGANVEHGLRRSNKDKRHAIKIAVNDPEWSGWSNRRIADLCKVDEKTVRRLRDDLQPKRKAEKPKRVKSERKGKTVTVPAGNDKKDKPAEKPKASKPAPKTQDQINQQEFNAAIDDIAAMPHDGKEAAKRWKKIDNVKKIVVVRDWLNELLEGLA